eukprot:SAG22_NODE_644_length_8212_cov_2.904474_3_plen_293_part_00
MLWACTVFVVFTVVVVLVVLLQAYHFVGRFVGLAIWKKQSLPIRFAPAFLKQILNKPVTLADYVGVAKLLRWNRKTVNGFSVDSIEELIDVLALSGRFTVETEFGEVIELRPGGAEEVLTNESKDEFVELLAQHLMTHSVERQIGAFCAGLGEHIPLSWLGEWFSNPSDLSHLISGPDTVSTADWRAHTRYSGQLTASSDQVKWYWEHIERIDDAERLKILRFVTGKGGVPAGGFKAFEPWCAISSSPSDATHLPVAHTCSHELEMPAYPTKEVMLEKLSTAVENTVRFDIA